MSDTNFIPTTEQRMAVEAAKTRENLVITAGAGTGKTSTLRLIADALAPLKGLYIAYNKAIQTDAAASFPANVQCRTAHSLAYRAVGKNYQQRLRGGRMTGRQIAYALDIEHGFALGNDRELHPSRLASLVMQTVGKFCHSADARITVKHTPSDIPGTEEVSHDLASFLAERAQRAWDTDLTSPTGKLPFTHDMYVKIWALTEPTLPGDFILYDEAQDADPCIAAVVLAQRDKQLIAVGDECQAIYGWRGATDAMRNWPASKRVSLTKSFRFGPAVAEQANIFLARLGSPLRIEGAGPDSVVGPVERPDAILCRTNAAVIAAALANHEHRNVAVVGGTEQIRKFAEAAQALMDGRSASWHADLGAFKTWGDVVTYVDEDESGSDLRSMVNMVRDYGTETITEVCNRAVAEDRADLVLSTAHKAKGREWDGVVIADDFQPSEERLAEGISRSELMLMYVAVTRAQKALDNSALAWVESTPIPE